MKDMDCRFCKEQHVLRTMLGDEMVLLDERKGVYLGLDEVGTRVWQLLESGHSGNAVAAALEQEYAVDPGVLQQDVAEFITELRVRELMVVLPSEREEGVQISPEPR